MDVIVLDNLLNLEDYKRLINSLSNPKSFQFYPKNSRYCVSDSNLRILAELKNKLVETARKTFNSKTLIPTYALFAHYEGKDPSPNLSKHKDDNACTYTLDMCVYQNEPWDIFVEDKAYTLHENQALAYYGNDQYHWREDFPNPDTNTVGMIFFHFAEPDHWYFTEGPEYLEVIRGNISKDDWSSNKK